MAQDKVTIFDTTLRDGEQSAGAGLTTHEKLEIAKQLDLLGVDVIEAGFAASSPGDFEAVQTIAGEVRRPIIASLARCHSDDIDAAWRAIQDAERPRVHVFISSSDVQIMHQLRRNPEEVMDMAVSAVERAKGYCEDVEFSPMDATRTDLEYLYQLLEATIAAGATTVNIADTVGYTIPAEFAERIALIRQNVPNIDKAVVSVHCHNDLGLAAANTLAAVSAGARQVEGCINGLGERDPQGPPERPHGYRHDPDIPDQPPGQRHHRIPRSGEQGDRRRERLPPRVGYPSGRDSQGTHDLRDHGPGLDRLAQQLDGARQAERSSGASIPSGGAGVQTR